MERASAAVPSRQGEWDVTPFQRAARAIAEANLAELQEVVAAHPALVRAEPHNIVRGPTLIGCALRHERKLGCDAMQQVIAWLAAHGQDEQAELNEQLCGHLRMKTDDVRWLLAPGANPHWTAPNGLCVLENALLRCWNGEAVDVVAAHVTPKKALWIAAGLGDVDGVRRLLDRHGKPTKAARASRPPLDSVGVMSVPMLPDADDEELLRRRSSSRDSTREPP